LLRSLPNDRYPVRPSLDIDPSTFKFQTDGQEY
jgi:hypothetical protein